ncbi:MAG: SufE family protein [Bacteroidales bacterium]|nr:SufE family protein [Bacteroidales bacterium]
MTIQEIENEIIEEFASLNELGGMEEKILYIIELGKGLLPLDEKFKTEQYLISGCQSRVWISAESKSDKVYFQADSDAIITKGIIALLIRVLSGQSPEDIINAPLQFIDAIGLKEHLSPTRSNGLVSMIKQMKLYALAIKTKNT